MNALITFLLSILLVVLILNGFLEGGFSDDLLPIFNESGPVGIIDITV